MAQAMVFEQMMGPNGPEHYHVYLHQRGQGEPDTTTYYHDYGFGCWLGEPDAATNCGQGEPDTTTNNHEKRSWDAYFAMFA